MSKDQQTDERCFVLWRTRSLWIAFALALMSVALEAMLDDPPDRAILRGRAEEWSTERIIETYLSILPIMGTALNLHV